MRNGIVGKPRNGEIGTITCLKKIFNDNKSIGIIKYVFVLTFKRSDVYECKKLKQIYVKYCQQILLSKMLLL